MSIIFLRVKIRSLADEARIIRHEEQKLRRPLRDEDIIRLHNRLHCHRTGEVRRESRSAQLAYGFLRGRSYARLEPFSLEPPDINRVVELVHKYGDDVRLIRLAAELGVTVGDKRRSPQFTAELIAAWMKPTQWPFEIQDGGRAGRLWIPFTWKHIDAAVKRHRERRSTAEPRERPVECGAAAGGGGG